MYKGLWNYVCVRARVRVHEHVYEHVYAHTRAHKTGHVCHDHLSGLSLPLNLGACAWERWVVALNMCAGAWDNSQACR